MQWNSQKNAGFSNGEAWLPINDNYQEVNIETQSKDPQSMFSLYKKLLKYRKNSKTLTEGNYVPVGSDSSHVYVYMRESIEGLILVALNFSDKERSVRTNMDQTKAKIALSSMLDIPEEKIISPQSFKLRPNEGLVMEVI